MLSQPIPDSCSSIHAIIYDLDSTIIDTVGLHIRGMQAVEKEFNLPVDFDLYQKYYGRKLRDFIAVLYNDPAEFKKNIDAILKFKQKHFLAHIDEVKIYPGFEETVEALKKQKKKLWICTSAPGLYLENLAQSRPIFKYFKDKVTFQEMYQHGKPDPESLQLSIRLMGNLDPAHCLYIGDAANDYQAAQNAQVKFMLYCSDVDQRAETVPTEIPRLHDHRELLEYLPASRPQ